MAESRVMTKTIVPGQKFGAWTVARTDATGRRIWCICDCGTVRQIALGALEDGSSRGCGCNATPRPRARRRGSALLDFGAEIAALEAFANGRTRRRP